MVDVKELMNENLIEFTKEIAVSVKIQMFESMNTQTVINTQTDLAQFLQPELITQEAPQSTPRVEDLNSLIK